MKNRKRIIALVLALIFALALAACGSGSKEKLPANRLEAIKERGYIEVCTEPYFAPYEFIDSSKQGDEQYVGMDIEIAKYIAEKLGVELRLVPLEFSCWYGRRTRTSIPRLSPWPSRSSSPRAAACRRAS